MALMSIGAVDQNDQVQMCSAAAQALARGNPAGPGLRQSCGQLRNVNIAQRRLFVDAVPVDPDLRVNLTNLGESIIASTPALQAVASKLGLDRRGYAIGVAIASAAGGYDPAYAAWVAASGLSPQDARGLALATAGIPKGGNALSASNVTKAINPSSDEGGGGIPTAVYVGGGVVVAVGLAALAYKFLL